MRRRMQCIGSTAIQPSGISSMSPPSLTADQLNALSEDVGTERSLLVLCSAFRGKADRWPNLTVKKIPHAVLKRCEWGHDDYSLKVENLPEAPPVSKDALTPALSQGGERGQKVNPGQASLFGEGEE